MRKLLMLMLLIALTWLVPVPTMAEEDVPADYLVMFYLCGTDLETQYGAATADLSEMLEAGLPDDGRVCVLVQTGGTAQWQNDVVDSARTQRFLIADELYSLEGELDQLDMGDPDTLSDFVRYGLEHFPAARTSLILWDHGGGASMGVCSDEYTRNTLSTLEVYNALHDVLSGTGFKFDFIGFDACLMSTVETANHIKDFADYMIASEDLEPGCGWTYDAWLNALANDGALGGAALGQVIVDSFIEGALASDPDEYVTLSVTDLSKVDELGLAVSALGEALGDELDAGNFSSIARARAGMRAFGDYVDAASDMVDVAEVAQGYRALVPDVSDALMRATSDAVVYSRNSANIENACGLTMLLPDKTKADAEVYMPTYDALNMTPGYTEFVNEYLSYLLNGSYAFDPTPIATTALDLNDEATLGWLQLFVDNQQPTAASSGNWLTDLFGEDDEQIVDSNDWASLTEAFGGYAHSVQLSGEDLENLSFVEAALLQDAYEAVGDDYGEDVYFDYGLMYDVHVDWESGMVYGLFDGTWPTLEGQMVPMYDQVSTASYTRSLIPVQVNGEDLYLLVVFNENNPYGAVIGYTQGYDDNGNPARGHQSLKPGDVVTPIYDLIYWDAHDEMQTEQYVGTEIVVGGAALRFGYEPVESGDYHYAFCLNDVFGGYQYTDYAQLSF